jgi:hypothetical protein
LGEAGEGRFFDGTGRGAVVGIGQLAFLGGRSFGSHGGLQGERDRGGVECRRCGGVGRRESSLRFGTMKMRRLKAAGQNSTRKDKWDSLEMGPNTSINQFPAPFISTNLTRSIFVK